MPGQRPNIAEQGRTGTPGTAAPESPVTATASAGAVGGGNGRQLAGEVSGILRWKPARKSLRAHARPKNERRPERRGKLRKAEAARAQAPGVGRLGGGPLTGRAARG